MYTHLLADSWETSLVTTSGIGTRCLKFPNYWAKRMSRSSWDLSYIGWVLKEEDPKIGGRPGRVAHP